MFKSENHLNLKCLPQGGRVGEFKFQVSLGYRMNSKHPGLHSETLKTPRTEKKAQWWNIY